MAAPTVGPTKDDLTLSHDLPGSDQVPAIGPQTILVTGWNGPLSNLMELTQAGVIMVAYEYADRPASSIYMWHQGGATQPINPGWNTFNINAGDCIMWTLSSPTNYIKIAWQYA